MSKCVSKQLGRFSRTVLLIIQAGKKNNNNNPKTFLTALEVLTAQERKQRVAFGKQLLPPKP